MLADPTASLAQGPGHRWLWAAVIAAAVTGVLAAGLLTAIVKRLDRLQYVDSATVAGPVSGNTSASRTTRDRAVVSQIERSASFLVIPALNVDAPLVPTGAVGAPGTASLTIPADVNTVGWWNGTTRDGDRIIRQDAPAPGEPGVAVIAGHVDSASAGPGALHGLATLRVGDAIEITDSNRERSSWIVDAEPETAPKTGLPARLWVTTGRPRLALVTCGGRFDTSTDHYLDNVIVWASAAPTPFPA